jgi:fibro-slime domain-containing protein
MISMHQRLRWLWFGHTLLAAGCGEQSGAPAGDSEIADASAPEAQTDGAVLGHADASASLGLDPGSGTMPSVGETPDDYVKSELGGYKLGQPLTAGDLSLDPQSPASGSGSCTRMVAVVRDFRGADEAVGHPDFQVFDGKKPTQGLVAAALGPDQKPVYSALCEASFDKSACAYGQMTTSASAFAQWYRNAPGTNLAFRLDLAFAENDGVFTFQSDSFFPLDEAGFGNSPVAKRKHNFSFTTELHSVFRYRGGEAFAFTGDDDLWVFINGHLAIDLGGLHPPASARVDLDEARERLGITVGNDYRLDLFHAERHSANSNFRLDTTLEFTDCGHVEVELL